MVGGQAVRGQKRSVMAESFSVRQDEQLLDEISKAHTAWLIAMENFNHATEKETVDDAIYLLIAAERRYEGLLRVAKRRGLGVDLHGNMKLLVNSAPVSGLVHHEGDDLCQLRG